MKAGKYTIKELFVNRYLKQIVIPEIQRDYVWGKDQLIGLLNSIKSDFNRYQDFTPPVQVANDPELEKAFQEFCQKRDCASNIGFIYAYNDEEYQGRYFLIDGQQRITSMYLVLLTLASRNEELKEAFKKTYLLDGKLKLDYKVREASHNFLFKLVPFILKGVGNIEDQHWFYSDSENDVTIRNLVKNLSNLKDFFDKDPINEITFYQYLEDFTEFWYFDTNVSEQGEELYIYMNARGEQMQSNENIKADLLSHYKDVNIKNAYGQLWEDWQDFFWVNKGNNKNADRGFNEFLAAIAGLENYLNGKEKFIGHNEFEKKGIKVEKIISALSLSRIEQFFNGFKFLLQKKDEFKANYHYVEWIDKCIQEIWNLLNIEKTNWFANFSDENRGIERNRMVFLWSTLYYLSELEDDIEVIDVFRAIRSFYLKLNNYIRSVKPIKNQVDAYLVGGALLDKGENFEESLKVLLLDRFTGKEKLQVEETIWEIEDHYLNLNGKFVGGTNISHLVDLETEITLEGLKKTKDKFFEIFEQSDRKTLQNILLYYGEYWDRITPKYYINLEFNDWKRIIRGIGERDNEVFKSFFSDFLSFSGNLEAFYQFKKLNYPINRQDAEDLRQKLLWYSQQLDIEMWRKGNCIAIRDWMPEDDAFPSIPQIFNTRGDFKGGWPQPIFEFLPKELKEQITAEKLTEPLDDQLN